MTKLLYQDAADGVEVFIAQAGFEIIVEVIDGRQGFNNIIRFAHPLDGLIAFSVGLVFDVPDDVYQHILDGDQPGNTTVLIDYQGHMVALLAEFAQQHVDALALGHNIGRAQERIQRKIQIAFQHQAEQVFGQQYAFDVVETFANHRKTGVAGFDDLGEEFARRLIHTDGNNLRTGNHQLPRLLGGYVQSPFDNGQCVLIQQLVVGGFFNHRQELFPGARFAIESVAQAF